MPRTLSPSSVRAARDLQVAVSRLRRRAVDLTNTHELTPSQPSVLSRLGRAMEERLTEEERETVVEAAALLDRLIEP